MAGGSGSMCTGFPFSGSQPDDTVLESGLRFPGTGVRLGRSPETSWPAGGLLGTALEEAPSGPRVTVEAMRAEDGEHLLGLVPHLGGPPLFEVEGGEVEAHEGVVIVGLVLAEGGLDGEEVGLRPGKVARCPSDPASESGQTLAVTELKKVGVPLGSQRLENFFGL